MSHRPPALDAVAHQLVERVASATSAASNETQLRHEIEKELERVCELLHLPWTPFQMDRTLRKGSKTIRFVDVAHGAVVIEYEAPASFRGGEGSQTAHAKAQVEEYALLLAHEEGRAPERYVCIAWDGAHIAFGRRTDDGFAWERLSAFDQVAATRLIDALKSDGVPLVHALLLSQVAGPESHHGTALIPLLFQAIRTAENATTTTKTKLLFSEWRRLFGQAIGTQPDALRNMLAKQGEVHGQEYKTAPASYLFALHTYVALLAKLVAACALPNAGQDIRDHAVAVESRMVALESGALFENAGIVNMLSGDFFSWYLDDPAWARFGPQIDALIARLAGISFDVSQKTPGSTRDLFKGIYESFVPRALRHALGEFYTPDWLAEHALNVVGWGPENSLLDPTCGSGTFVLEALRRRLERGGRLQTANDLLAGLHGFDLNPLAVLTAKGSLAVYVAPYLDPSRPTRLPIYMADAVNPATLEADGQFSHVLQTEIGPRAFRLPHSLISRADFFQLFARVRELVDADFPTEQVLLTIEGEFAALALDGGDRHAFASTIEVLCELHERGWNGIWCPIVADRFMAGAIEPVEFVCGNPPWVKWSHLPPEYAAFIGPRCRRLGVFSSDRWVGGIESDMSTVITFEVIDTFLADGGKLAFFITGTVFANESSEGFRQFRLHNGAVTCEVLAVEDYDAIAPFDGVSNRPTLLLLRRGGQTNFPVPYRVWSAVTPSGQRLRSFKSAASFTDLATYTTLLAQPVPGGHGKRPWLIGTEAEHVMFAKVFSPGGGAYVARKGITTDRNGIFWVTPTGSVEDGTVRVRNCPEVGRAVGIAQRTATVDAEHVFPLLRGRGVARFRVTADSSLRILLPQRGMHGDPALPQTHPHTFRFLRAFKPELERRSSFKRFQLRQGHPYYSLWSTGDYSFAAFKVVWREMGGGEFAAAYAGTVDDPVLGLKLLIPDHKVYFIPVASEAEAAYLTGLLNSALVSGAVSAYASQLSLGASVAEYLHLPPYDPDNGIHRGLSDLALKITHQGVVPSSAQEMALDELAHALFDGL